MLILLYYQVAEWEFRYLVHTLPLLVVPSAFALTRIFTLCWTWAKSSSGKAKGLAAATILTLALALGVTTERALSPSTSIVLQSSYFREVSRLAAPALADFQGNPILIAATPWPYYFHLRKSAWGLDRRDPEITLRFLPKNRTFLVVSDFPLHIYFPSVAKRLSALYRDKRVGRFTIGTTYQYAYFSDPQIHRVAIYRLSSRELRHLLTAGD